MAHYSNSFCSSCANPASSCMCYDHQPDSMQRMPPTAPSQSSHMHPDLYPSPQTYEGYAGTHPLYYQHHQVPYNRTYTPQAQPGQNQEVQFHNTFAPPPPPSSNSRAPLSTIPSSELNLAPRTTRGSTPAVPTAPASRQKRQNDENSGRPQPAAKRRNTGRGNAGQPPQPTVYGVGPSTTNNANNSSSEARTSATTTLPVASPYSTIKAKKSKHSTTGATDVWFFMEPLESELKIPPTELSQHREPQLKQPNCDKYKTIGCRLCSPFSKMKIWKNSGGQLDGIRKHFLADHELVWKNTCIKMKLKGWESLDAPEGSLNGATRTYTRDDFTVPGFLERLSRFFIVCDKAPNLIDCPELRDLLLYLGCDNIEPHDLPHRNKLADIILERFTIECDNLKQELANAKGRVSLTSDLWSAQDLTPYMAVTAHYMGKASDGSLELKAKLLAFRFVKGRHNGDHLGDVFFDILREWDILQKLGTITLDNASNCNTMMRRLEQRLKAASIPFSVEGNRIRCFPHVVNLCVKAGLKRLTKIGRTERSDNEADSVEGSDSFINDLEDDSEFLDFDLHEDLVADARKLAVWFKASFHRLDDLSDTIDAGHKDKTIDPDDIPNLRPRKDMDVRWSSSYYMIDRILVLHPAMERVLRKDTYSDAERALLLSEAQLLRLTQIRDFLEIPHSVQELLSSEKTPTLCMALPAYEHLLSLLKVFRDSNPEIAYGVDGAIEKLEEYLQKTRKTRIYSIAMIINPTTKMQWLEDNWDPADAKKAKEWLLQTMTDFRRSTRLSNPSAGTTAIPADPGTHHIRRTQLSQAARRQQKRKKDFNAIKRTYSASNASTSASPNSTTNSLQSVEVLSEKQLEVKDRKDAEDELKKYLDDGLVDDTPQEDDEDAPEFNLVKFWQDNRSVYKLLYRVALDIMPAQASAVPSERVFSSAKETDTLRRANMGEVMMEVLQVTKFNLKSERLDFNNNWVASEADLADLEVVDVEPGVLSDLIANRRINELTELVHRAHGTLV